MSRAEIAWKLSPSVVKVVAPIRKNLGEAGYSEDKRAFQDFMCGYFNADDGCTTEQGSSISPVVHPTKAGWKCLKVRWAFPGAGKSGGLRLAVAVHCDEKRVNLVGAWIRKDEPAAAAFDSAFLNPSV